MIQSRAEATAAPSSVAQTRGLTVFGCAPDEAALFRELAPGLGLDVRITEAPASYANALLASGSRCVSVGHQTRLNSSTLWALRQAGIEYISTRSVGYDHIDVELADSLGITVENVRYSPDAVADYTLMLILMALRNAKSVIRRATEHDYRLHEVRGRELRDLTVGVVGTGRIGTAVIERLQGFGCRILAHDIRPESSTPTVLLDELLRQSDVVTLHTPFTAATHHLLDRDRLERLRDGAIVVNTGRGALIDTEALLAALEGGRIGGAALDVVEGEDGLFYRDHRSTPLEDTLLGRLQALPNVIISPHTAYFTDHALRDTVENSLLNCLQFEGRESRD